MTEDEFEAIKRDVRDRTRAISDNGLALRIARADVARLEASIELDKAEIEKDEQAIAEHWHDLFAQGVTA